MSAVSIVTGAGSGIGRATSIMLAAAAGSHVFAVDLPETLDSFRLPGGRMTTFEVDITDPEERQQLEHRIGEELTGQGLELTGLINCAGISGSVGAYSAMQAEEEHRLFEVNYFAIGDLCRTAVRLMPHGGSIVNIASLDGFRGRPRMSAYSASKHAVVGLTRSLARELAGVGIRVNAVAPGPVETPMMLTIERMERDQVGDYRRALLDRVPLGRYAKPEEIAAVICFLVGSGSSYVTGAIWEVDGGISA
jgi:NAD(P)-dependent dehydrogenase (short-subunit alcohol dehydrogenase family)